jgi:hypothetical protein
MLNKWFLNWIFWIMIIPNFFKFSVSTKTPRWQRQTAAVTTPLAPWTVGTAPTHLHHTTMALYQKISIVKTVTKKKKAIGTTKIALGAIKKTIGIRGRQKI